MTTPLFIRAADGTFVEVDSPDINGAPDPQAAFTIALQAMAATLTAATQTIADTRDFYLRLVGPALDMNHRIMASQDAWIAHLVEMAMEPRGTVGQLAESPDLSGLLKVLSTALTAPGSDAELEQEKSGLIDFAKRAGSIEIAERIAACTNQADLDSVIRDHWMALQANPAEFQRVSSVMTIMDQTLLTKIVSRLNKKK